jgi:hypothetical protein
MFYFPAITLIHHANLNRVCKDQSVAFEEGMKLNMGQI